MLNIGFQTPHSQQNPSLENVRVELLHGVAGVSAHFGICKVPLASLKVKVALNIGFQASHSQQNLSLENVRVELLPSVATVFAHFGMRKVSQNRIS